MTWQQLLQQSSGNPKRKTGINYEPTKRLTDHGKRLATVRMSRKIRGLVYRDKQYMVMISVHLDHDSAYRHKS